MVWKRSVSYQILAQPPRQNTYRRENRDPVLISIGLDLRVLLRFGSRPRGLFKSESVFFIFEVVVVEVVEIRERRTRGGVFILVAALVGRGRSMNLRRGNLSRKGAILIHGSGPEPRVKRNGGHGRCCHGGREEGRRQGQDLPAGIRQAGGIR